jgi:CheY-like chemotaxis protein
LLAESLGGNVGVESEKGAGALFYVCVPLRRAELPAPLNPAAADTLDGIGGKALIVEDEHYNQVVLSGIALELGYAPEVADSVAQAATLSDKTCFDVVLVDWELPDGEGGDVARRVRGGPDGARPVVIATTAYDSDEIHARCAAAGMDGFLLKPYDALKVRDCIARVRRRRAGYADQAFATTGDTPTRAGLNLQAFQFYGRRFPAQADKASELYVEALEQEFFQLKQAFEAQERKAIAASAHRLHALGGLVGATDIVEAAKKLTAAARQGGEPALLAANYAALTAALESVKVQLASTE